ncbi:adenosylcobinamide-GDP ribazoletransferase [Hymenobacter rubripertinctus]|uniref:Adenosylcobinamide-GDP ribazoletransferase n=1 Tax=Hymenobacter rubripertinctus TaxID=2029981 RepID=A0A418QWT2_9BACT|nr:adenosylcobinamide-GDP ribazoletransferase [Hymenobacter rubripertinctus]RIY09560.1 adenosylcobinamide-GDP ribazoletransferase [Hymenobacter rubripertinctus]
MTSLLRHHLRLLLLAVQFYTRLPIPAWVGYSDELLNKATIYFPVIGWLVGGLTAAVYAGGRLLFHQDDVALVLSLGAGILLTGAFHEDGFADTCDGFGGGWTKLRILEIMKDSRLGTYGAVGLLLLLALKLAALRGLSPAGVSIALLVAHPLSRATALTCIFSHQYARENEDSKAKPVAKKISRAELATGLVLGALPLLVYAGWARSPAVFLMLLPVFAVKFYLARYFQRWIGGYTGDCLGAIQQTAEVTVYLFFLLLTSWSSL